MPSGTRIPLINAIVESKIPLRTSQFIHFNQSHPLYDATDLKESQYTYGRNINNRKRSSIHLAAVLAAICVLSSAHAPLASMFPLFFY